MTSFFLYTPCNLLVYYLAFPIDEYCRKMSVRVVWNAFVAYY